MKWSIYMYLILYIITVGYVLNKIIQTLLQMDNYLSTINCLIKYNFLKLIFVKFSSWKTNIKVLVACFTINMNVNTTRWMSHFNSLLRNSLNTLRFCLFTCAVDVAIIFSPWFFPSLRWPVSYDLTCWWLATHASKVSTPTKYALHKTCICGVCGRLTYGWRVSSVMFSKFFTKNREC